jgi:predicted nucleotidyltransferase
MGTVPHDSVAAALFSRSRLAVLGLLYSQPDVALYLRQIVARTGLGTGQIQRELKRLSGAGVLRRFEQGRHVYFQASDRCPIYDELRSLLTKTVGAVDVLRASLRGLSDRITVAFIYGSVALGHERQESDLDLLVIGDTDFREVIEALSEPQERIRRQIHVTTFPLSEFRTKVAAGHHFLSSVLGAKKLFVIGDENDLRELLEQPVA